MRFEKWVARSEFSKNAGLLFSDAIKCYKAEAHRASLLFSYLAFLTILKERVLSANKPALFPDTLWQNLIKKLQNEDKWEEAIYDATQQYEISDSNKNRIKDPVFSVSDSLRFQIRYWKDRRNDCAHFKDNEINGFHTENFWSFLESNLSKITIEGGRSTLLNNIKVHYDLTYTPRGKDVTHLVKQISSSVESKDLQLFWQEAFLIIEPGYRIWLMNLFPFINAVFNVSDEVMQLSFIAFIKKDDKIVMQLLSYKPSLLSYLNYSAEELRNLWRVKFESVNGPNIDIACIYAYMLANDYIPKEEIREANLHMGNLHSFRHSLGNLSPQMLLLLQEQGMHEVIDRWIFVDGGLSRANADRNTGLIYHHITNNSLTRRSVEGIVTYFNNDALHPVTLSETLNRCFKENEIRLSEFNLYLAEIGCNWPKYLASPVS
jgi:hypothetical protein